jgi:hypothetical protein
MKKIYLVFSLLLILSNLKATTFDTKEPSKKASVQTSEDSGNKCFDENTKLISAGVGFGGGYSYYNYNRGAGYKYNIGPVFSVSYEQALKTKAGPGYVALGGYIGYRHTRYRYDYVYGNGYWNNGVWYYGSNYYYEHKWNHIFIAARGTYHWDELNWEKGEIYGGLALGFRIQTYTFSTNDNNPNRPNYILHDNSIYPAAAIFFGARWYPAPKIAIFTEVGYGISILTFGVSFKL